MNWMNQNQSIGVKIRMQLTPAQLKSSRNMDAEKRSKYLARLEDEYIAAARQSHKQSKSPLAFSDWFRDWQKHNRVHRRPRKEVFRNTHLDSMGWNDD